MPSSPFAKLKQAVTAAATTAVVVKDKALRTAAPVVRRAAGDVTARVTRKGSAPVRSSTPDAGGAVASASVELEAPVSPASVARNIGRPRPSAKPAAPVASDPDDSPGGRLPPRH